MRFDNGYLSKCYMYLSRFLITEHIKPCMHILEISVSSLNHVIVRPTKTPKLADKKMPISDFQSEFSISNIIQIFLKNFFIEEYQSRGTYLVIGIQFFKHLKW